MELVGVVSRLFRYGVKSMQGLEQKEVQVTWTGFVGDRRWVVRDEHDQVLTGKTASGAGLLECGAIGTPDDYRICLPDMSTYRCGSVEANVALSGYLGQEVYLTDVTQNTEDIPVRFKPAFALRPGVGVDSSPLHFLTTATLETLGTKAPGSLFAVERFRPNILISPTCEGEYPEDEWVGRVLHVGKVTVYVRKRTFRCPMTTQAQPAHGIKKDPHILRTIIQEHSKDAGVYATVISPGVIRVGDEIWIK